MAKHCVMGAVYGVALSVCGMPYNTWQFWVLMPLAALWATIIAKNKHADPVTATARPYGEVK